MELITRKYALKHNLKYYFTGKPCKNNHIGNRYTENYACVECSKKYSNNRDVRYTKKWRENNPNKVKNYLEKRKEEYKNPNSLHYRRMLLHRANQRAKKKNLDFDLCIDDIIVPSVCPIFGIKLIPSSGKGANDNSPSLDRINPNLGYTKDNVWIISQKANRIKNDSTLSEMKIIVDFLENLKT